MEEIRILHQLSLVVYPFIYKVLAPSKVVVWDSFHLPSDHPPHATPSISLTFMALGKRWRLMEGGPTTLPLRQLTSLATHPPWLGLTTVDGKNPANHLMIYHYLQGGNIHPRWCRISSINSISHWFSLMNHLKMLHLLLNMVIFQLAMLVFWLLTIGFS